MRLFKSIRFAWSKEILNGVVMYKAAKPKNHDFEYTVLVRGKRLNNTSDKSVVMKHRRGDVKILLSVEHGLTRRRDVNDAIRIAVEKARFGLTEAIVGLIPGWGGTQRLPRMIPWCKAAEAESSFRTFPFRTSSPSYEPKG